MAWGTTPAMAGQPPDLVANAARRWNLTVFEPFSPGESRDEALGLQAMAQPVDLVRRVAGLVEVAKRLTP